MKNNLVIHIPTYTEDHSAFPKPVNDNYEYWVSLLKFYLEKSDMAEIHCWNEETETIDEIKSFHTEEIEMIKQENLIIFKWKITSFLTDYLLFRHLNKNGELKWFTVNLNKGLKNVFHSGHWGTEFLVPHVTKRDVSLIQSVTPEETDFYQF